jgi:methylmalonyl-CoA mutase cobalamin-binding subunit
MDMTCIDNCSIADCAYNKEGKCHTMAITVGSHAECNTFVHASARGGFDDVNGGVGACQTEDCVFNERLECQASVIGVSGHDRHADCKTFRKR